MVLHSHHTISPLRLGSAILLAVCMFFIYLQKHDVVYMDQMELTRQMPTPRVNPLTHAPGGGKILRPREEVVVGNVSGRLSGSHGKRHPGCHPGGVNHEPELSFFGVDGPAVCIWYIIQANKNKQS